jgi:hypothetical protein
VWPELPKEGFISSRPASPDDIAAGNAVFVLEAGGKVIGKPIDIEIPQYAYHVDGKTGKKTPGIIIQAEHAQGKQIVGMRALDGTEIAGLFREYELLGTERPG